MDYSDKILGNASKVDSEKLTENTTDCSLK